MLMIGRRLLLRRRASVREAPWKVAGMRVCDDDDRRCAKRRRERGESEVDRKPLHSVERAQAWRRQSSTQKLPIDPDRPGFGRAQRWLVDIQGWLVGGWLVLVQSGSVWRSGLRSAVAHLEFDLAGKRIRNEQRLPAPFFVHDFRRNGEICGPCAHTGAEGFGAVGVGPAVDWSKAIGSKARGFSEKAS